MYDTINPPKQEQKKKDGEDAPTKKKTTKEQGQLSPAMMMKALNEHFDLLNKILQDKYNQHLALVLTKILIVFHQDDQLP